MEKQPNVFNLTTKNVGFAFEENNLKRHFLRSTSNSEKLHIESQDLSRILKAKDEEIANLKEENSKLLEKIKAKDLDMVKLNALLSKMKELEKDNLFLKKRLQMLVHTSQHIQGESLSKKFISRSDSADCYRKLDISSSKTRENSNFSPASQDKEIEKRIEILEKNAESLLNSPFLQKNQGLYKERILKKEQQVSGLINSVQPIKKVQTYVYNR